MKPYECDVRAVQRGDNFQVAIFTQHLVRDPCRRGMRDGVVYVHQVQLVLARGIVQSDRERERVRGMLEERVVLHLHLVEEHPLTEVVQAERLGVRDEVYLVPALSEREA